MKMPNRINITKEQILDLLSKGYSKTQIAKQYGCCSDLIRRRLRGEDKPPQIMVCAICGREYPGDERRQTCGAPECQAEWAKKWKQEYMQNHYNYVKKAELSPDGINHNLYTDDTHLLMAIYLSKGEPLTQMARDTGRPLKELQEHLETDKAKIDRARQIMDIQHRQSKPGGVQTVVNWSALDRWDL